MPFKFPTSVTFSPAYAELGPVSCTNGLVSCPAEFMDVLLLGLIFTRTLATLLSCAPSETLYVIVSCHPFTESPLHSDLEISEIDFAVYSKLPTSWSRV